MVNHWDRSFIVLAVCLSLGLAACGGDDDDEDVGVDAGDTGPAPDGDIMEGETGDEDTTGGECIEDADCPGGEVCEDNACEPAACESNEDCDRPNPVCNLDADPAQCVECLQDADCTGGEVCADDNTCSQQGAQCASVGDACDPDGAPAGSGFNCVDIGTGGECLSVCDAEEDDQPCPSGQLCLPASNSQDAETVCYTSQCTGPDDLDNCDEVDNHPLFTDSSDFKCVSLANDTDLCMPDGSKAEGESCTAASPVVGLFCQSEQNCEACESGNTCVGGTCRQICRDDASDDRLTCGDDEASCVGAGADEIVSGGAGFCGEECDAYSRGQCSQDGQGCTPLNNEDGYCTDIGDKGFMDSCEPASLSDPTKNECQEGMQCITFQSGAGDQERVARCMPICNAPAPDEGNRDENDATCGGKMYGRFAYLGQDPSEIDVYLNSNLDVDDLASGMVSDADMSTDGSQFFAFNPAELQVQVVEGAASDASNPLVEASPFAKSGQVKTWAVAPNSSGDLAITAVDVPVGVSAPSSGQAKVRAVHLVPDITDDDGNAVSVDVVAVPESGSLDSDAVELLADAGQGAAGDFAEIAPDTYDLYVFEAGEVRDEGNQLVTVTGVDVSEDDFGSIYLRGTVASGDNADLGADFVPYTSAPRAPDYTCWNRGQQEPAPASGLCLQGCEFSDYGQDSCFAEDNGCSPLGRGGDHFCVPQQDNQVGESCDPNEFQSCAEGAACREYGDGSGTCHSYCVGGDESNPALTCAESRSCTADEGAFGQCNPGCMPGEDYADGECPEFLQTCFPESVSDSGDVSGAYCSPSHDVAEGNECGGSADDRDITLQNCQAGMYCAYDTATEANPFIGEFVHRDNESPTCKKPCDPFADSPDCPDGQACGVDLAFQASNAVGVCMEEAEGLDSKSTTTSCTQANVGKLCGDHSHCITTQGQNICYEFCNWSNKEGCTDPNQTCQPFANGPIGGLGICAPE